MGPFAFLKGLFSVYGVSIAVYLFIGLALNTAPPHFPGRPVDAAALHSWIQWAISIFFWPLGLWHPTFTLGKWTGH